MDRRSQKTNQEPFAVTAAEWDGTMLRATCVGYFRRGSAGNPDAQLLKSSNLSSLEGRPVKRIELDFYAVDYSFGDGLGAHMLHFIFKRKVEEIVFRARDDTADALASLIALCGLPQLRVQA